MAAPLSLYLDLERGQKADLEKVARAVEAFADAIKEVAYVLDPSIEIRIEFVDGTESSLIINTLIRAIKGDDVKDLTLKAVVFAIIWWFTTHALDWTFDKTMDFITGESEQTVHLSDKDKQDIADMVAKAIKGKVAQPQVQRVYRELESDPSVKGVGATQHRDRPPSSIVPRENFATRSGYSITIVEPTKRRRVTVERLLLISPVLKSGKRRWKFAFREGEFGAQIKDQRSIATLLGGRIPMREGIELDAELETIEELRGSVWVPIERSVLRVIRVHPPHTQADLLTMMSPEEDDDGEE